MQDDMLMLKQQTEESGFSGMLNDAYCNYSIAHMFLLVEPRNESKRAGSSSEIRTPKRTRYISSPTVASPRRKDTPTGALEVPSKSLL
jgi:hypothetical protein